MTRRPTLVRQAAHRSASAPPELWLSEDPAYIHVIDNNGGFLLANLPMHEACLLYTSPSPRD